MRNIIHILLLLKETQDDYEVEYFLLVIPFLSYETY